MSVLKSVALAAVACSFLTLSSRSQAQTFWGQYGKDPQHTAMSTNGVQALNSVLWQTAVDLFPVTDGTDVLAHYGSPLVTANTVVVNVRVGTVSSANASFNSTLSGFGSVSGSNTFPSANDVYRVEGHDLGTGTTLWTEYTDFVDWMPHDWTPSYASCIDSNGVVYSPGAGGTVWAYSNADSASGTSSRVCFYGLNSYFADETNFNSNVQICTPISVDSNNNIYFGFYVTNGWSNSPGLASGIAKISSTGVGTWVTADSASGDSGDEVATNCAPAITADGNYVYVAVKQQGTFSYSNPKLLRLNTTDLSTANAVGLTSPVYNTTYSGDPNSVTFPYVLDDGTASPMIGPDGDVYFGVWWSDLESRGFMLHYSADLGTVKTAGAFGWDDTASVVPASAVPSYGGTSSYLILTKYNNYSDAGGSPFPGDGQNKVAILDPNDTEVYTVQYDTGDGTGPSYITMKEILSVVGVTPNTGQDGVREWCINMAAIDVAGKAAIVNSEDGHCYRWDFTTNSLTQVQDLQPATGEAYTPTVVSGDGISFAVNNAELYAMWDGAKPSTVTAGSLVSGSGENGTVTLTANATGAGATIQLSSDNANVQVPASVFVAAGSNSKTFPITSTASGSTQTAHITATRYGFTATKTLTASAAVLAYVRLSPTAVQGGQRSAFAVYLNGAAPTGGVVVNLSSSSTDASMPTTVTVSQGATAANVLVHTVPVSAQEQITLSATYGSNTWRSTLTLNPATLTGIRVAPTALVGGANGALAVYLNGEAGSTGDTVTLSSNSSDVTVQSSVIVSSGATDANVQVTTAAVSSQEPVTLSATFGSTTLHTTITLNPPALTGIKLAPSSVIGGAPTALAVYLNGRAPSSGTNVTLSSNSADATIDSSVFIQQGSGSANVVVHTAPVSSSVQATITATLGSAVYNTTLTLNPATLHAIKLLPTSVIGGNSAAFAVYLNGPAGPGGTLVTLSSSSADAVIPATVLVPEGATAANVHITTSPVASSESANISANLGSTTLLTTLTINP